MNEEEHILADAKELRGNWRRFESFAWHRRYDLDDPEEWGIVYTHNRDSNLLEESNADVIKARLEPFLEVEEPDLCYEEHNHWAVGWVGGWSVRCLRDGEPTEAFKALRELMEAAREGIIDEEDYYARLGEAADQAIEDQCRSFIMDDPPEDWVSKVYEYLREHHPEELDDECHMGPYPSEAVCKKALLALSLHDPEEL